ncbi:MAG: response regulator [Deltaproteobacteria bacterium]|nr:response regulator [Deltaproteobacteria bacterium]
MVRDLEHRVLYWNRSCERIYGWKAEEIVGRIAPQMLHLDRAAADAATAAVVVRGEWSGELDKVGKDGRACTIEARWSLLRDAAGAPRAILAIETDITARKRLEQQVMRTQRLESLGTLAGGIAHDLNNVLSPILMAAVVLEESEPDAERRRDLETIRTCAERGADMIKQLLAFARGQDGDKVPLDLAAVAADVERLVRETFPRSIATRFDVAPVRWRVLGDGTQMHQMLVNLCVNARDAMPRGGLLVVAIEPCVVDEVQASMHPDAKPGPYVLVRVEDNGVGMSPEVLERIFEPFFTTKPSGQGTGFGLSTVHTIVRSHGGFISVYSEPGQGARFRVYLPAAVAQGESPELDRAAPSSVPTGHGELVLVVDDEESIRFVTQRTLERFGYRVLVASNGAEAVAAFARHRDEVAVVLTDMAMPIMDGPATIVALRAMSPSVPIIGSSGLGADGLVAKSIDAGARWFVDKPYTADALLRVVRRALHGEVV